MVQHQSSHHAHSAASTRDAGNRVFYRDVPQYHPPGIDDLTPEQKSRLDAARTDMDEYIQTVDPYNLGTIIMYASDIPTQLNTLVEQAHRRREAQDGFMGDLATITRDLSGLNLDTIAEKAGNIADNAYKFAKNNKAALATGVATIFLAGPAIGLAAGAAVAATQGTANIFARARNLVSGGLAKFRGGSTIAERESNAVEQKFLAQYGLKPSDFTANDAEVERIRAEIRQGRAKAENVSRAVDESIRKIPETMHDLNAMGLEYQTIYSETCVAIGAAREIIRRMQDEMIPSLRASEMTQMTISQLGTLVKNADQMKAKADNLDMQRSFIVTNIDLLQDMIAGCGDTLVAMQNHRSSTIQTIFQQAEIGMNMLDLHDRIRCSTEIDQMQISMVEQQERLRKSVQTLQETKELQSAGTKVKLAALAQTRIDDLDQRQMRIETYRKINDDATARLQDATEKTIEAFDGRRVQQTQRLLGKTAQDDVLALGDSAIATDRDTFNTASDGTVPPALADSTTRKDHRVDGPSGVQ